MQRVLVTGGGGYIGSTLVRLLLDKGYNVRVIDRFYFGKDSLDSVKDKIELVKGDVRAIGDDIFKGVDAVMDLAALSNDPSGELDPQKTIDINYLGRVRIALLAKKNGVKRYILASSCSVYGNQEGVLTEESPVRPLTTYAKANHLAEKAVLLLTSDDFTVTVLRQATVYGLSYRMRFDLAINGMTFGLFKTGKINVLRDGTQWRPFVHVKDTSKAFIMVMEAEPQKKVSGQIFNVGSNTQNIQILNLAKRVAAAVNQPFNMSWYGDPDKRSYQVSFDKISQTLGYKPDHTFEGGVREIYKALETGDVMVGDRTKTVVWYKTLLEWKGRLDEVVYRGEVL